MANSGISSCRDRTSEFHSTIRTFQSRMVIMDAFKNVKIFFHNLKTFKNNVNPAATQNGQVNKAKTSLENRSKFMLIAK